MTEHDKQRAEVRKIIERASLLKWSEAEDVMKKYQAAHPVRYFWGRTWHRLNRPEDRTFFKNLVIYIFMLGAMTLYVDSVIHPLLRKALAMDNPVMILLVSSTVGAYITHWVIVVPALALSTAQRVWRALQA